MQFLDHTQRGTTVGRTPLDEWSARRRDLYLTAYNNHNWQIFISPAGFEFTILVKKRSTPYATRSQDPAIAFTCPLVLWLALYDYEPNNLKLRKHLFSLPCTVWGTQCSSIDHMYKNRVLVQDLFSYVHHIRENSNIMWLSSFIEFISSLPVNSFTLRSYVVGYALNKEIILIKFERVI